MIKTRFKKKNKFHLFEKENKVCIHSTLHFMFLYSFNDIFKQTLNETSYHRDLLLWGWGLGAFYWNYSMLFPAICFLGLVDDVSAVLPE